MRAKLNRLTSLESIETCPMLLIHVKHLNESVLAYNVVADGEVSILSQHPEIETIVDQPERTRARLFSLLTNE